MRPLFMSGLILAVTLSACGRNDDAKRLAFQPKPEPTGPDWEDWDKEQAEDQDAAPRVPAPPIILDDDPAGDDAAGDVDPEPEPDGPEPEADVPDSIPPVDPPIDPQNDDEDEADDSPTPFSEYQSSGPWAVTNGDAPPGFTIWRPASLGEGGVHHPVITWGNGTGMTPDAYAGLLRHLASHGFLVIASRSTMTGSGRTMQDGIDWLLEQNQDAGSIYYDKVKEEACTSGHSQGGMGSINAGTHTTVVCIAPIEPTPGNIADVQVPMFLIGGGADLVVMPAMMITPLTWMPAKGPAVYGILQGATHFEPFGDGGRITPWLTAWMRAHLMDDTDARTFFYDEDCRICGDQEWKVQRKNL